MKESISLPIALLIVFAVLFTTIMLGFNKQEKMECQKWQGDAKFYTSYYFTDWQIKQCQHHEIELELK